MTKMMKETNRTIQNGNIWNGNQDIITITYRISKQSAFAIVGTDEIFDCESVYSGVVYFENGKAYMQIEGYSETECDAIAFDLINARL